MTQQEMNRVKRSVIRKYPIFASVALLNLPIEEDNNISTAAVYAKKNDKGKLVLKGIKYNPEFFDNLSFEQQVFVLAHETCHIAFKHFARCLEKPEKDVEKKYQEYCEKVSNKNLRKIELMKLHKKYYTYWNIATDACINAFLKKDGLEMPEGVIDKRTGQPMKFVNIEDGLYRRAELIYDSIVRKEENNEKINEGTKPSKIGGGLDDIDIDDYQGIDSHDEWVVEPKKQKEKSEVKTKKYKTLLDKIKGLFGSKDEQNDQNDLENHEAEEVVSEMPIDESEIFKKNEEQQYNRSLNQSLNNITREAGCFHKNQAKPILSWKQLLVRSVEEEKQVWGYRRASRYSPNARIEDRTLDDNAITEIILDTSGSISDELIKGFLMQLIPLFKESKIKVGCFAGKFYGFTELKTIKQIEEFKAISDINGTNYEAAATAFSRDNERERINRIVFTDGMLDGISEHTQKTKVDRIMWIVCGDKINFTPLGGKIIKVNQNDLNKMLSISQSLTEQYNSNRIDNIEIKTRRR